MKWINKVFVQIGATRDGLDAYHAAAVRRGMETVLIEMPEYHVYRSRRPGCKKFDVCAAVDKPSDPKAVWAALDAAEVKPDLVLPGFEQYVPAAFALARVRPLPPFEKADQRRALAGKAPGVAQPQHARFATPNEAEAVLKSFPYPAVVKPVNGGGGLGVYMVADAGEARRAVARQGGLRNYDGSAFPATLIEELVTGTEFSVQGVVVGGRPRVLSVCEKVIGLEPDPERAGLTGFRELGYVAWPGDLAPPSILDFTDQCIAGLGYANGPFHIDLIRKPSGELVFIETGYRLSGGGLVELVRRVTGQDWAEVAFAHALGEPLPPVPPAPAGWVGQCLLTGDAELRRANAVRGVAIEIEAFSATPPGAALAADRLRHAGFAGRARFTGPTRAAVFAAVHETLDGRACACAG